MGPRLRRLHLHYIPILSFGQELLEYITDKNNRKHFDVISIDFSMVEDLTKCREFMCTLNGHCDGLRIRFSDSFGTTHQDLFCLARNIGCLDKLTHLEITSRCVKTRNSVDLSVVFESLPKVPNLRELKIADFDDNRLVHFLRNGVASCAKLKVFSLGGMGRGTRSFDFGSLINTLPSSIEELSFKKAPFDKDVLDILYHRFGSHLKKLTLIRPSRVSEAMLQFIVKSFSALTHLHVDLPTSAMFADVIVASSINTASFVLSHGCPVVVECLLRDNFGDIRKYNNYQGRENHVMLEVEQRKSTGTIRLNPSRPLHTPPLRYVAPRRMPQTGNRRHRPPKVEW